MENYNIVVCLTENSAWRLASDRQLLSLSNLANGNVTLHLSELPITERHAARGLPYRCGECNKCFTRRDNLRVHMRKHSGDFRCAQCRRQFSQNRHLLDHVKAVHEARRLQCVFCQKWYSTRRALKQHVRTHTGLCDQPDAPGLW